ncbi:MAG: rhomboid family intramembrane serine protease [Planctomycetota bacterium]
MAPRFQTCPKCAALLEPGTKVCPYCGTDQAAVIAPSAEQDAAATNNLGVWLIGFCVVFYMLMVLLDPGRGDKAPDESPLDPTGTAIEVFGAHHPFYVRHCGQYWRIVTANFIHLDTMHLLFNCIAIFFVIPLAGMTFGAHRTWVIFLVTGLLAVFASNVIQNAGGGGASGAICGMIGALGIYGWRRGGYEGQMLTRRMGAWALFILAFGLLVPNVDNVAHGVGFVAGAAIGWFGAAVRARGGAADKVWQGLAYLCLGLVIGAFGVGLLPNVLRSQDRRDVRLFNADVQARLQAITDVDATERRLRPLDEGPPRTEAVRTSVNRALTFARNRDMAALGPALREAYATWRVWQDHARCAYQIRFNP